ATAWRSASSPEGRARRRRRASTRATRAGSSSSSSAPQPQEQALEGLGDGLQGYRLAEHGAVPDLATGLGAEEAVQLVGDRLRAVLGLVGEGVEAVQLALGLDQRDDLGGADRPDQLLLEIAAAGEEALLGDVLAVLPVEGTQHEALLALVV